MKIHYRVDIQHDFMKPDGALYVPKAEQLIPILQQLTAQAFTKRIPIFESVDSHFGTDAYKDREQELQRWGGPFPDHCMIHTLGQERIPEILQSGPLHLTTWVLENTLTPGYALTEYHHGTSRYSLRSTSERDLPSRIEELLYKFRHGEEEALSICFEKQHYDVATNRFFDRIMQRVNPDEAVVYGVATDYCVKAAVLNLRRLGIKTLIVEDAITGITPEGCEASRREMEAAGALFVTSHDILEARP